jgi:hypothetical protein
MVDALAKKAPRTSWCPQCLEAKNNPCGVCCLMNWIAEAEPALSHTSALIASLAREVETLKAAVESHKAEVEHWVQRYNEIDAWRQQTAVINARLTAENKAGAVAVVDHLTKEVERLTAENQRLKDDCGKPLTEGE